MCEILFLLNFMMYEVTYMMAQVEGKNKNQNKQQ